MNPEPLDFDKIEEEIINELNGLQPHDLQTELDVFKKIIKQYIKQACEFYLRYKDVPYIFCRVYPKYRNKLSEILGASWEKWWITPIPNNSQGAIWIIKLTMMEQMHRYNEWLFKLVFKDVLEEEE